jgi:GWxTD domain-containing protein
MEFLSQNDLDSAEIELNNILKVDSEIPHAYYGLGLVYNALEAGSDQAMDKLEMAIELDPDFLDAHYQLGLIYEYDESGSSSKDCFRTVIKKDPHYVNAWIALARVEKNIRGPLEMPTDSKPLEILAEGLEINPEDKAIYEQFKKYAFWYTYEELSVPTFKFLIGQNPQNAEYSIGLARAFYHLEQYKECLNTLDTLEQNYTKYPPFDVHLIRSKVLFNTGEEEQGLDLYWHLINSIQDSSEAKAMLSDICYIMLDPEYDKYQSISIKELPDFYTRFWLSRDPDLSTEKNERIAEHFIRLKYAQKHYRRYESGSYKKAIIYKLDHPMAGKMNVKYGVELINEYESRAMPKRRSIDDRGLIYIRHGEPDNFAFYNCSGCPQNMSWLYLAIQNRKELIFHFRKQSEEIGWFLETLPYTFRERGDFGGLYAIFDPSLNPRQDFIRNMPRYDDLNIESIENIEIALETETSNYNYDNTLIEFPLDLLSFKGADSKTNIDLFYGIEGTQMELDVTPEGNGLTYSTFTGIFDENWGEIIRSKIDKYVPLDLEIDEWEESSVVGLESFSVLPGDYNCEFHIQDGLSDKLGIYKGSITIPDYWGNELILSDILLSGPVAQIEDRSKFKKGSIKYDPHMFTAFPENATVGIYMEIYNLAYDYNDRTTFAVSWYLREAGEDDEEGDLVQSALQYSGNSRDDKIYFNLELSDIDSDEYELIIRVKDIISDIEKSQIVKLTVL